METPKSGSGKFDVLFMVEAREFLAGIDVKARNKIIYNIDRARLHNDKELFKKLKDEIWEFRTLFNKTHYRLFAFWDKTGKQDTLVISTHGIIKRTGKTPDKELDKAETLRKKYFILKKQQQ
ncbi:MAG: type II toxin-antitoxin system RelE/ParE family toxin [Bacteroidales bacterium]